MSFEQTSSSYAHVVISPERGEKGWISRFHATLKAILSMRMGRGRRSGETRNCRQ